MNTNKSDDRFGINDVLWRSVEDGRHFIVPEEASLPAGRYGVCSTDGAETRASASWLARYEVTEAEAHAWAKQEFGIALGELRRRIDARLGRARAALDAAKRAPASADTDMTPDALPALLSLAKALPRAIFDGLSGDPARVVKANGALAEVEARLNRAGIAIDHRLSDFPYRLAGLRAETARSRQKPVAAPSDDDSA
jgi:hypothetical protein